MQCRNDGAGGFGCLADLTRYYSTCIGCRCAPSSASAHAQSSQHLSCRDRNAIHHSSDFCICSWGSTCYDAAGGCDYTSGRNTMFNQYCKTCTCRAITTTTTTTTTLSACVRKGAHDLGNGLCECGYDNICYADSDLARRGCGLNKLKQFQKSCESCSCDEDVKFMENWRCCLDTTYQGREYGGQYKWMLGKQLLGFVIGCPSKFKQMTDTSLCDNLN